MTLHYHGLPLTPFSMLDRLKGEHLCISFATKRTPQTEFALQFAQSIMLDNGAFSRFTQGLAKESWNPFYAWIEPMLAHPHWAVIPDVIGGDVEDQKQLVEQWPFSAALGAPVWHLGLPIDYLLELTDNWPKVCLGSSGEFWKLGSPAWEKRMDLAFNALAKRQSKPWIHGLRMLAQVGKRWWLASADSANVARNYNRGGQCPACMALRIDSVNGPMPTPPRSA